ncbi:hypothetical protein HMN09_00981400 [Mycena chlorophos]|uniref:F-box domain-containing protein n=1 Tax=Mycena chlorophos TaxID=658473 RepID=A0A8H6SKZ6_MYCCL|nr:hypothetical protein HMN09_00981400 [Mycena chlorophos]
MVKHSLRWAKIEFSFPLQDRELFEDLSHLAVKDVPLLKSFRLKSTNQVNAGTIPWTSLRFLQTPTLKSFFVSFGGLAMDLKNIHNRWNQLTTLEIAEAPGAEFPAHEILSILDKCPALRWCQLTLPQWPRYLHTQQAVHSQPTQVLCPELRRLGISGTFEILSSLLCPQLRHLVIGEIRDEYSIPRDHNEMSDIGPLLHILSSSSLLEIFNCRATISRANLGTVFRALPPTLLKLGIFDDPSHPQVDDKLLHDLAEQQRCPLLEDIYFYKCQLVSMSGLATFLRLQTADQSRALKNLFAFYNMQPSDTKEAASRMKGFADAGVRLVLRHIPTSGQVSPFCGLRLVGAEHLHMRPKREENIVLSDV